MSKKFGQLLATFENMQDVDVGLAAEVVEGINPAEADDVADEVNAEGVTIDEMAETITDATEGGEQLNELAGYVESAEKRGGMSSAMAQVVELTHEAIVSRLGMSHRQTKLTHNPVMSLENYKSADHRLYATKVTVEDIKKTAKEIIQKIIAMIVAMAEKISNFFVGIVKMNSAIETRLKYVEDKASKVDPAAKAKETHVKAGTSLGDNPDEIRTDLTLMQQALKMNSRVIGGLHKDNSDAIDITAVLMKKLDGESRKDGKVKAPTLEEIKSIVKLALECSTKVAEFKTYGQTVEKELKQAVKDASGDEENLNKIKDRLSGVGVILTSVPRVAIRVLRQTSEYLNRGLNNLEQPEKA